jgi:signal transduction histidine kinase
MPQGGLLRLSSLDVPAQADAPAAVQIAVQDSGAGVEPEVLQRLFQPFASGRPGGTGLGLWISRNLVQRYGGDLRAANAAGGGAVFTVHLPVQQAQ